MTLLDTASAPQLSIAMRDGSRAQHDAAESSVFVEELMGGRVNAAGYVNYLRSLRHVYVALEEVGRTLADHPVAGELIDPALDRVAAIDADIATWSTGAAEEELVPGVAAQAYADTIRASAAHPERYVAHHYTRYLGDLSGGQFIGKLMSRQFELGTNGIGFYVFDEIADPAAFKDVYREQLDAAPWDPAESERVIDEVLYAYQLNTDLFVDLADAKAAAA